MKVVEVKHAGLEYLTLYNDYYVDKDDLLDHIRNKDEGGYSYLSDKQFDEMCEQEVNSYVFKKYIVISM